MMKERQRQEIGAWKDTSGKLSVEKTSLRQRQFRAAASEPRRKASQLNYIPRPPRERRAQGLERRPGWDPRDLLQSPRSPATFRLCRQDGSWAVSRPGTGAVRQDMGRGTEPRSPAEAAGLCLGL